MKAASALLRSDAGHCSDRVTLQRPMNTTTEESEKTRVWGREEGAIFFSYPGSFSFCIPAPPFSSRKDCQKTKRDRIGVKKDYSLKLEQKPASRALLLQRPSTMCQENFNQRSLPYVCVFLSLFLFLPLSLSVSPNRVRWALWYLLQWRLESPCRNSGIFMRWVWEVRGVTKPWEQEVLEFEQVNFSVCCDFSSVLRLVCLYLLCIFEVHSSTFTLDLSGNAVALPSTTVLISLHFCMRFSSDNCFCIGSPNFCVPSKLSFLQEIWIFGRKTFAFSQKVCIPLRNTYLLVLSTNFLLISLSFHFTIPSDWVYMWAPGS